MSDCNKANIVGNEMCELTCKNTCGFVMKRYIWNFKILFAKRLMWVLKRSRSTRKLYAIYFWNTKMLTSCTINSTQTEGPRHQFCYNLCKYLYTFFYTRLHRYLAAGACVLCTHLGGAYLKIVSLYRCRYLYCNSSTQLT